MSDDIPFEIQVEIIKRLPIKSLIQFRSVSKPWKLLIDSSRFIADYSVPNSQSQRLLVSYTYDRQPKYVLIDDEDAFPQRKCSLNVPTFIESVEDLEFSGSSNGLLCFHGYYDAEDLRYPHCGLRVAILWNPSIRKSVVIEVPNHELGYPYNTVVGFGVCPNTNDPKIVKIHCSWCSDKSKSICCIPFRVEVFTLSSRAWRIPSRNLPRKSICFRSHIVINEFIYWLAFDRTNVGDIKGYNMIISFNLTSEEFREIHLPRHLAPQSYDTLSISKSRDSLLVTDWSRDGEKIVYHVWMMEHGVQNSFTKLFTIDAPDDSLIRVLGCKKNGEPMLQTVYMFDYFSAKLKVYEPSSKHIKDLGIYGDVDSFFMRSYMETLMLLDQPDCNVYSDL